MSEVTYKLKAYRDDSVGSIGEMDILSHEDHRPHADYLAKRFGLGAFVKSNISGTYMYEDGEILTYWTLTPLL